MSFAGIKKTAEILTLIQSARQELMRMGATNPASESGKQDMGLSHMLSRANDLITPDFIALTSEPIQWKNIGRPERKRL